MKSGCNLYICIAHLISVKSNYVPNVDIFVFFFLVILLLSLNVVGRISNLIISSSDILHFFFWKKLLPQETSSKCFGSSKTSRISLVDLAGMERNKLDDAGILRVREGKNVKKSLSQLGYDPITL